jgi:hypothetical protein
MCSRIKLLVGESGIRAASLRPHPSGEDPTSTRVEVLRRLEVREAEELVSCATDDGGQDVMESNLLEAADISVLNRICPKKGLGDLFAAAALVQVAIGASDLPSFAANRVLPL